VSGLKSWSSVASYPSAGLARGIVGVLDAGSDTGNPRLTPVGTNVTQWWQAAGLLDGEVPGTVNDFGTSLDSFLLARLA
jgi:hypothetical protein